MLRPTLAIAGAGEKRVNQFLVGLRIVVVDEGLGFGRRRWQAVQVEIEAADQLAAIGFNGRLELELGLLVSNEAIDVVTNPDTLDLRRLRIGQRPKTPEVA